MYEIRKLKERIVEIDAQIESLKCYNYGGAPEAVEILKRERLEKQNKLDTLEGQGSFFDEETEDSNSIITNLVPT